jgi:hypothetical protein
MSNLIQLRKKRMEYSKQLEKYSPDEEEYHKIWSELCEVARSIQHIENKRHIDTLRSGMRPLYRFLHGNFAYELFTPTLYRMMASCFKNIAHTDRIGFFNQQFSSDDQIIKTLEFYVNYQPNEKDYCYELELEIQEMISESHIIGKLKKKRTEETIQREKAELKRLLGKYCSGELPEGYQSREP